MLAGDVLARKSEVASLCSATASSLIGVSSPLIADFLLSRHGNARLQKN
jgi:hypothetical protein